MSTWQSRLTLTRSDNYPGRRLFLRLYGMRNSFTAARDAINAVKRSIEAQGVFQSNDSVFTLASNDHVNGVALFQDISPVICW